jgi:molybdopterin-guanine dinucleotide biosynthesis protein A
VTAGTAAILAGGAGRRLGGMAKDAIPVEGQPAGPRLVRLLLPHFAEVLVVTREPGLYAGLPAQTLCDLEPGFGPLSGLHAALEASSSDWLWLAACDMPAFDPRLLDLLSGRLDSALAAAGGAAALPGATPLACLARHGDHFEPFQALYSRALLPRLGSLFRAAKAAAATGAGNPPRSITQPSFKELFAGLPVEFVSETRVRDISPDWSLFFNINTPTDLEALSSTPIARDEGRPVPSPLR